MINAFDYLHVAAAVITNKAGEILIARRHDHLHQGGLWEFPGGKIEKAEHARDALGRELDEELGIHVVEARPLIRIPHHYPDRKVLLDVWLVSRFSGDAHGREGQAVEWVAPEQLSNYEFPEANWPIIKAAQLPDRYLITPHPGESNSWPRYLQELEYSLSSGLRLVQFRAKGLPNEEYLWLGKEISKLCSRYGAVLLLNGRMELVKQLDAQGVHLSSRQLAKLESRPLTEDYWVAASCHSYDELDKARRIGADFVVISPVKKTLSHPDALPIGWDEFSMLTEASCMPVYALGGMTQEDLPDAWDHGGQGIAAIRGLWDLLPGSTAKID